MFTALSIIISANGFARQRISIWKETNDLPAGFQEIVVSSSIKGLNWDLLLSNNLQVQ